MPLTSVFSALLAERDDIENRREESSLKDQCVLGLAAGAKELWK